jgi:hypothetical protein
LIIGNAAGGTNAGSIQVKSSGSSSAIGATNYTLALNPDGGFVGIGTTSPADLLEVKGSITIANVVTTQTFINMRQGLSSTYNCSISTYSHNGDGFYDGLSLNGYDGVSICTGSNTRQERVRIDSAGKVGIGTTSPLEKLDIRGGSISMGEYFTSTGSRYVGFGYNDGSSYRCIAGMEIENTTLGGNYSQKLHFRTHAYGAYEGRSMTIAEGGQVTIPRQPAFSAYRDAGNVPANTVFVCNNAQVNTGNHYNASNGRFTAPVAGTYLFAFHCMGSEPVTTYINVAIRKNGAVISYGHGTNNGAYDHTNVQVITTMAANDYVDAFVVAGYQTVYGAGNVFNNFNGHLIG